MQRMLEALNGWESAFFTHSHLPGAEAHRCLMLPSHAGSSCDLKAE